MSARVMSSSSPPLGAVATPLPAPQARAVSGPVTSTEVITSGSIGARRPSPWHEIAHSLSTTSLPPTRSRRSSTPSLASSTPPFNPATPPESDAESQALRDWDRLLAAPDNDITRHALIHPKDPQSPHVVPSAGTPKLAAERDKEGHIEYKLKLIEPSQERFERLVTQMMWRLKQGRNEAIYELGLADDGTVIGLSRAEMDASLRTLERMASEVGATVIVLQEIVLTPSLLAPDSPGLSSSVSSAGSASTWWARRPDLDENGKPRKGTKGLGGVLPEQKSRVQRRTARQTTAKPTEDRDNCSNHASAPSSPVTPVSGSAGSDDEPTPFQLDIDDGSSRSTPTVTAEIAATLRSESKRLKAAARREQRRMDLLRGDGTSSMPYTDRSSSPVAEFIGHAPNSSAILAAAKLPHQPARPSSLRLARTHSGTVAFSPPPTIHDTEAITGPDDAFLDGLSLPLDSLSLSFADVTTMDESGAQTVVASPESQPTLVPEEMICVEALVVRKRNEDEWTFDGCHEEEFAYGGEEDGWGFGGEEDGWGFGGNDSA